VSAFNFENLLIYDNLNNMNGDEWVRQGIDL